MSQGPSAKAKGINARKNKTKLFFIKASPERITIKRIKKRNSSTTLRRASCSTGETVEKEGKIP